MKKSIRVEVMGRDYALRVAEENEEHMREVADMVDKRMRAFQKAHPGQPRLTAAVITSLAIAEELHLLQMDKQERDESTQQIVSSLNEQLAEVLPTTDAADT